MLIFSAQSLAFIAVPKTGTTAIEMALKPKADILFSRGRKHLPARRFVSKIAPFLAREFNLTPALFAVMRDPEEQIRSWFRYRARSARDGDANSTHGISFDAFVHAILSDNPPPYARIGSQMGMLCSGKDELLIDHLFAHDAPDVLDQFLLERFGEPIERKRKNVSPFVPAPLEPSTLKALKSARRAEFDLFARLLDAGGALHSSG